MQFEGALYKARTMKLVFYIFLFVIGFLIGGGIAKTLRGAGLQAKVAPDVSRVTLTYEV
ncbi:MAG: hypothetical protein MUF24_06895 [Chitinophagaceae bacterium]|nr:hypothetical protein [Chitinophagaceae bacterium]